MADFEIVVTKRLNSQEIANNIVAHLDGMAKAAAMRVANRAVQSLTTGGRSGKVYRGHQASAPGQPPALLTGDLARSCQVTQVRKCIWAVHFTDRKAWWLEYGTPTIAPRPYLRPAIRAEQNNYRAEVRKAVQKALAGQKARMGT
jgi:hypothetical protein